MWDLPRDQLWMALPFLDLADEYAAAGAVVCIGPEDNAAGDLAPITA